MNCRHCSCFVWNKTMSLVKVFRYAHTLLYKLCMAFHRMLCSVNRWINGYSSTNLNNFHKFNDFVCCFGFIDVIGCSAELCILLLFTFSCYIWHLYFAPYAHGIKHLFLTIFRQKSWWDARPLHNYVNIKQHQQYGATAADWTMQEVSHYTFVRYFVYVYASSYWLFIFLCNKLDDVYIKYKHKLLTEFFNIYQAWYESQNPRFEFEFWMQIRFLPSYYGNPSGVSQTNDKYCNKITL